MHEDNARPKKKEREKEKEKEERREERGENKEETKQFAGKRVPSRARVCVCARAHASKRTYIPRAALT